MNEKEGEYGVARQGVSRREFLKMAGMAGVAVSLGAGMGDVLSGCGSGATTTSTADEGSSTTAGAGASVSAGATSGRDLKIGLVSPTTGPLAAFALADEWYVARAKAALADGIVGGDGKKHSVSFEVVDSQSDSNRASQVAGDLILTSKVDVVLAAGSPDTVVPVADQCEANGTPGLFCFSPWQATFQRDSTPEQGYKWIWGYCSGSEQAITNYAEAFDQIPNNKRVGMLFANDADAQAWMAPTAAPAVFVAKGYDLVVPSYYTSGAEDFTAQISSFKKAGVDIVCGTNSPPDWVNFVKQALQQGFKPKLMSSGKCLIFPQVPEDLASACYNFIGEMAWNPAWPFVDSLCGGSCKEMADAFEAEKNAQWTQTIGMYAGIEWAVDLFKRAQNPEDKESVAAVVPTTNVSTCAGPIDFTEAIGPDGNHPVVNNVKPVFAAGQWVKGTKWKLDFLEISNATAPGTEVVAKPQAMVYL
jgi:branched-chain amino acid transport system substrate-binding protein